MEGNNTGKIPQVEELFLRGELLGNDSSNRLLWFCFSICIFPPQQSSGLVVTVLHGLSHDHYAHRKAKAVQEHLLKPKSPGLQ